MQLEGLVFLLLVKGTYRHPETYFKSKVAEEGAKPKRRQTSNKFSLPLLTASFLSGINRSKRILFRNCCEKGKPVVRRGVGYLTGDQVEEIVDGSELSGEMS